MGQYTQEGFVTCWKKLCPLAQGIGYGHAVIKLYDFIFVMIQVWSLVYLGFSFSSQLPWANCDNTWNTVNCISLPSTNSTANLTAMWNRTTSASTEFWERRVLGLSGGIDQLGSVRWDLSLSLLVSWVCCYFCIWKGIKSSGKVAYVTATFPYLMLLVLLIRGLTLPGAWDGISFYLYPDFNRLANFEVWIEAGSQIIFSNSLASGTLLVLGSFNKHRNNCYRDCFWLCLLNSGTSFFAGFVVFSVLGFMAHKQGVTVDNVADSGPGLAFIVYPEATAMMPLPQFWSVCFFLMLFFLSIDTHFVTVKCFIASVTDVFPEHLRGPKRSELFVLVVCSLFFLLHLLLVTEGGLYIFQLVDYYGCTRVCHYFMVLSESLALAWCFGCDRIVNIIEDMTGHRPSIFFSVCWKYIISMLALTSLILYLVDYTQLKFNKWYVYPDWAHTVGLMMTLSSVLMVPLWAVGQMCVTPGTLVQRWKTLCRPAKEPVRSSNEQEGATDVGLMTTTTVTT
ncbi:sodium- and chloride-dependent betaine transporter-like isoform X2 [Cynoglossus semilaevis]|nr:sodium- and chloride-dependent betaine transporter-like isoform X2 [Cynoglossus semilaevis]XP_024908312.1 sodium- and chloride-dependent betaine transporter-like isoform X2 [Cynoglossus semilaevis]XP_024908314.1 sodium- and chloride-dependent betaine transporter-like isoform X2 [Cynoglossus semilaevis]